MSEQKIYETIIIGGGISGLSCARRLQDAGRDFLLISKDLGGRMLTSKTSGMDYGAAYMTDGYTHVSKYLEKGEKLQAKDFYFFDGSSYDNIFSYRSIRFIFPLLKLLYFTNKLRSHLRRYRKNAPYVSLKEYVDQDVWLKKLWMTPARDFIKKNKLEDLDEYIGNPATATTFFAETSEVNTPVFLGMFLWMLGDSWTIDLRHTVKKLTRGYEEKLLLATVTKLKRNENGFNVETSHGNFDALNIVIAAPQTQLADVYDLPLPHMQEPAHAFHVVGRRREEFQNKRAIIFRPKHHDINMMWKQGEGGDIVYSKHANPDFSKYYELHHVVRRIHWHPGIILPGKKIIPQKLEKNLYLASDYNLSGLEDSFLTGLYAANQIIDSTQ